MTLAVPSPVHVQIELTTACNYKCRHCAVSTAAYPVHTLDKGTAFSLVDQMGHLAPPPAVLILSGHGESTVLPWFLDLVRHARACLPETPLAFHTNGSMLDRLAAPLVEAGIGSITVSVDGATESTFDEVRGPGTFTRLLRGLDALTAARRASPSMGPSVHFATTLMANNVGELPAIVELAAAHRVQSVTTQPLTVYDELGTAAWTFRELPPDRRTEAIASIARARARAGELGVTLTLLNDDPFREPEPEWHISRGEEQAVPSAAAFRDCLDPWRNLFVNARRRLNTCCYRTDDATEDVAQVPVLDVWQTSAGLNRVRQGLLDGQLDERCAVCPVRPASHVPPNPWLEA